MYTSGWSTTGNTHQCFGITAYNLCADVMGEDHVMAAQGSGWFWFDALYNVKGRYTSSAWRSYDLWFAFYTWLANSNYIIAAEETMEGTSSEVGYAIGQAYAIRAYSYFMLSQYFARTLVGHENEPCVPIYTEPTSPETKGQPRATNAEVYAQIDKDIDKAIELLKGTPSNSTRATSATPWHRASRPASAWSRTSGPTPRLPLTRPSMPVAAPSCPSLRLWA